MKYRFLRASAVFVFFLSLPVAGWGATDKGPETMNLKERFEVPGNRDAVIFPHRRHQAKLECVKCHIAPEGGGKVRFELVMKTGISNDFHKKFCWPCHVEMKVPKGKMCTTCHHK